MQKYQVPYFWACTFTTPYKAILFTCHNIVTSQWQAMTVKGYDMSILQEITLILSPNMGHSSVRVQ